MKKTALKILRFLLLLVFLATIVGTFGACDDDDDDDDDDNDDDYNDDNDDDDNNDDDDDDDVDDDDDNDDDDDEWTFEDRWGSVIINEGFYSSNLNALDYNCYAMASFSDPDDTAIWSDPVETAGDCERYFYDYPVQFDYNYLNGGNITISGAKVSLIRLIPKVYQYGYYYEPDVSFNAVNNLFDNGDTISYTTSGQGSIPAFSGSGPAPDMINVTQPSNFDSLTSVPGSDWTVSWSAQDADWVILHISTYKNLRGMAVQCIVPDRQGAITVSGSLMADLYTSADSLMINIQRVSVFRDTQDGKDLDFQISTYRQRGYFIYEK